MSIILPAAPMNFYTPSLDTLKNDVSAINGQTAGQVTILTEVPDDINSAWAEVGSGNSALDSSVGTFVIGKAPVGVIVGPSPAYLEGTSEYGYKLEFSKISDIVIKLPLGVDSILIVGFAVIVGRDYFVDGTNDDVRYINKTEGIIVTNGLTGAIKEKEAGTNNIPVNDGDIIELPAWELIINYAEPIT